MQPFAPTFPGGAGAGNKLTRLSKTLGGLVLLLSLVTFAVAPARDMLLLVPGRAIRLWSLLTAGFVTPNPLKALLEIGALLLLARIVEPIHGSAEALRIVAASALFGGAATLALAYILFVASPSRNEAVLYARFGGFHGVVGGLLVALKQAVPDAELRPFGAIGGGGGGGGGGGDGLLDGGDDDGGGGPSLAALSLRARYAPLAFVLLGTALAVPIGAWTALPYLYFGVYGAWLYLRYLQPQPGGGIGGDVAAGALSGGLQQQQQQPPLLRGDPSPEFRFATFFPDALAPPIDALAGAAAALFRLGRGGGRRGGGGAGAAAAGVGGSGTWGGFGEAKALLGGGDWASVLSTAGGGLNAALAAGRAAAAGVGVGVGGVGGDGGGVGAGGDDPNSQRRRERGKAALEQKLGALQKAAMGAAAAAGRAVGQQPQQQQRQQQQPLVDVEGGGGAGGATGGGAKARGEEGDGNGGGDGAAAALDAQQGPQAHALSPGPTVLGAGIAGGGTETDTADSAQLPRS